MRRLTTKDESGYAPKIGRQGSKFSCLDYCDSVNDNCDGCVIQKCFDRLGKYEDAEENGELVRLCEQKKDNKEKRVTLEEWLKAADPDTLVYLGAKDSSGFVAIDKPEAILGRLSIIDCESRGTLIRNITSNAQIISRCQIPKPVSEENTRTHEKKSAKEIKKEMAENKKIADAKIKIARKRLTNYARILIDWVPIEQREIKEEYAHTVDEPGTTVIIEGYTYSGYWFKHEYDEAVRKGGEQHADHVTE